MAFEIRPILTTIGLLRPDVDTAMLIYAVQAAVRETCRRTHLAQITQDYSILTQTNAITVALPATHSFVRVMTAYWKGASMTEWSELDEKSFQDAADERLWTGGGVPKEFSQQGGRVLIYRTPQEAGTLRIASSYVPIDDFTSAPLPEQAVHVVEAKALGLAMAMPGPNQSLQMAMAKDAEFRRGYGGLRSMAYIGEGGSPSFQVPSLL